MKPCYKICITCGNKFQYTSGRKTCSIDCQKAHEKTVKIMRETALRDDIIGGYC